jgi:ligand-binding sensor domain-containing protein
MRFSLITIVYLLYLLSSYAQELSDLYNIQFYGIEEGLSHCNTHTIIQDNQGVIWIGTEYGLNRFNGYNFK